MKAMIVTALTIALAGVVIAAEQEKAPGLTGIAQENARVNQHLTPEQIQAIAAAKAAAHQQRIAQMQPQPPRAAAPSPFVGIIAAENVPNPFLAHEFTIINFWGSKTIGVYSGFKPDDPSRGYLVVFDSKENTRGTWYEIPGGPSAITSASKGTLFLRAAFTFDLATRRFK